MRVRTIVVGVALVSALALTPAVEGGQVVSDLATPCLNLRPSPGTAAVACLAPGERVDVLERSGEWARVRTSDGADGWVALGYLIDDRRSVAPVPLREALVPVHFGPPQGGTLYEQLDSPAGVGFASQVFDSANAIFDCRAADDFTVPVVDVQWDVASLHVSGTYLGGTGPTPALNVEFLADGGGVPGAVACSYPGLLLGVDYGDDGSGNLAIRLPSICSLPAGTYWVSVQADMDSTGGGQWLWSERSAQSGSPFAWENPPDGFGTGCVAWSPAGGCGASAPDLLFRLLGEVVPVELQTFAID